MDPSIRRPRHGVYVAVAVQIIGIANHVSVGVVGNRLARSTAGKGTQVHHARVFGPGKTVRVALAVVGEADYLAGVVDPVSLAEIPTGQRTQIHHANWRTPYERVPAEQIAGTW